jgi:hypothetical protein
LKEKVIKWEGTKKEGEEKVIKCEGTKVIREIVIKCGDTKTEGKQEERGNYKNGGRK